MQSVFVAITKLIAFVKRYFCNNFGRDGMRKIAGISCHALKETKPKNGKFAVNFSVPTPEFTKPPKS